MGGGQRHAQPASAVILAQQHHGGALRAGELREELRLADERLAGANDGFLADRRGDERVEFLAQTAFGAFFQPGDRRARGGRRTFHQVRRQRLGSGCRRTRGRIQSLPP